MAPRLAGAGQEEEAASQKGGFASRLVKKRSSPAPGPPGAHLSHTISNGRDSLDDDEPDEELEAAAAAANEVCCLCLLQCTQSLDTACC